ncbi:MAG: hypothetical protein WA040_06880 [Anaerolineae bacterium]
MQSRIISQHNYLSAHLNDWEQEISSIYLRKNARREREHMWLRAVSDASKVGEAIRKGEYREAVEYLVHTFAWTLTTINKLSFEQTPEAPALITSDGRMISSTWDLLMEKYPGICPYCGYSLNCHCVVNRLQIAQESKRDKRERLRSMRQGIRSSAEQAGTLPKSLPEIAHVLKEIYGQSHYEVDIDKITFHFLEEVGEVAWCLTSLKEGTTSEQDTASLAMQLAEEFADTIAWSFAIFAKLAYLSHQTQKLDSLQKPWQDQDSEANTIDHLNDILLPTWLWYVYEGTEAGCMRCPSCHSRPCSCGLSLGDLGEAHQ